MTQQEFLEYLKSNSVSDREKLVYTDTSPLSLPFDKVELIGEGIFNKVYNVTIGDRSWIIKEGRYDLDYPITRKFRLPVPRRVVSWFWGLFNKSLMPSHEAALLQFEEYVLIAKYFGLFDEEGEHSVAAYEPDMLHFQRHVRQDLFTSIYSENNFAELILQSVKTFKNYHKIKAILHRDEYYTYNFLPQEYLILSISSGIKKYFRRITTKRENFYIVQDHVEGIPLGKMTDNELFENKELLSRLIFFILLSMYMAYHESKVIDSRPEGLLQNINEWFSKTGNIFVNPDSSHVTFIDTRWLWDKDIHQRGIGISDLIIDSMSNNLAKYVDKL
ncbi:MAG: hypothetical protein ACOCXT_03850 [Candidatus Dojkabacteria bacterium]